VLEDSRTIVSDIKTKALRKVRGMWLDPEDPDYNPDGMDKRSDCPMRTAAAVELVGALLRSESTVNHSVTIRTISIPEKRPAVDVEVVEVFKQPGE
jgi:hypothetical protein